MRNTTIRCPECGQPNSRFVLGTILNGTERKLYECDFGCGCVFTVTTKMPVVHAAFTVTGPEGIAHAR